MMAKASGGGGSGNVVKQSPPHPAVEAARHAAEYASAQVSHMAAQHAANVVAHVAAQHHSGHMGAAHIAAHVPDIRSFVHHQAEPFHGVSPVLMKALQMAAAMQPQAQPQGQMMWNGSQWVPAQNPGNGFQPAAPQSPAGPSSPNGNDSIASNGGGNGILGYLMGLA